VSRSEDDEFDTWLHEADSDLNAAVAAHLDTENMLLRVKQGVASEQTAPAGKPTPAPVRVSALDELAERLAAIEKPLTGQWDEVGHCFRSWVTPGFRSQLRDHLARLEPAEVAVVMRRSRETTTHFAWCLRDRPDEPFTFWLHEYKPQRDWRPGFADSVHNHRFHLCTMIVSGGYLHERYQAEIDANTEMISDVTLVESDSCEVGAVRIVLADEFHRIPVAQDSTMTFLVKSRPVYSWSLSFDPATRTSHQHVPVEQIQYDNPVQLGTPESQFDELVCRI
jgi:hypothetical protein